MLGERLKKIRKEKKLSQKEFAEPLGTSSGYISEVEQGKKTPGGDFLLSLSRVWKVSIDWLLTGEGEPYIEGNGGGGAAGPAAKAEPVPKGPPKDLVCLAKGQGRTSSVGEDLLALRRLDPTAFAEVCGYIKGTLNNVRASAAQRGAYTGEERREGERRQDDEPDTIPETGDRRSGQDRRKAAVA